MNGNFSTWFLKPGWMVEDTVWADQFHVFMRTGRPHGRPDPVDHGAARRRPASARGPGTTRPAKATTSPSIPKSGFSYEENPELPVKLAVVQFSPVIARNYKETSYPVAVYRWVAVNPTKQPVDVSLLLTWENMVGWEAVRARPAAGAPPQASFVWDRSSAGNVNEFVESGRHKGILFRRQGQDVRTGNAMAGTMAIAVLESPSRTQRPLPGRLRPARRRRRHLDEVRRRRHARRDALVGPRRGRTGNRGRPWPSRSPSSPASGSRCPSPSPGTSPITSSRPGPSRKGNIRPSSAPRARTPSASPPRPWAVTPNGRWPSTPGRSPFSPTRSCRTGSSRPCSTSSTSWPRPASGTPRPTSTPTSRAPTISCTGRPTSIPTAGTSSSSGPSWRSAIWSSSPRPCRSRIRPTGPSSTPSPSRRRSRPTSSATTGTRSRSPAWCPTTSARRGKGPGRS